MSAKIGPAGRPAPMLYCGFCGKNQDEVRKLIAGPSVFICDECVVLCMEIVDEEFASLRVKETAKTLGWDWPIPALPPVKWVDV